MTGSVAQPTLGNRILRFKELGILVAVLGTFAAFAIDKPLYFPTEGNAINIINYAGPLTFVALAMTMVLLVAEVDLSIGATYVATGCLYASLIADHYVNIWEGLIITLAFGAFLGLVNGVIVVKSRVPSLIITLGTMLVYETLALVLSGGTQVTFNEGVPTSLFYKAFGGFLIGSRTHLPGIPTQVVWIALAGVVLYVLVFHTRFGNWSIAVGDRPWAALTSGIPVARVKVISFIMCSTLATFASILALSQVGGISPVGSNLVPFEAIGATVIGGTSLFGGSAAILGAILGAVLIAIIENGVEVVGASPYAYEGAIGAVVVIAALVNIYFKKKGLTT